MADLGNDAERAEAQLKVPEAKLNSGTFDGRRSATPGLDYEGEKERSLAQAALTIAELGRNSADERLYVDSIRVSGDLLEISPDTLAVIPEGLSPADAEPSTSRHIPLRSINAVSVHIPSIESARLKVTADMESMILEGLTQAASYFPVIKLSAR